MEQQDKLFSDPKNYQKMSEPHADSATAEAALEAFQAELGELRKKHGIANVLCIIKDSYLVDDEPSEFITMSQFGSQLNMEPMAAYALGATQAERHEMIVKVAKDAGKRFKQGR